MANGKIHKLLEGVDLRSKKLVPVLFLVLFVTVLGSGCASQYKIGYKMDDIKEQQNELLSKYTLDVEVFEDIRQSDESNKVWFSNERLTEMDGKSTCINAEKLYEKGKVSEQISQAIAAHLKKRGAFKDVTFNQKEKSDFYLVGKIKRYAGKREYNSVVATTGAVTAQFGILGAIVGSAMTANIQTPGILDIEITDISIYRKDGSEVYKLDALVDKTEKNINEDGHCWSIFSSMDEQLKHAVDKLAGEIETAMVSNMTQNALNKGPEN